MSTPADTGLPPVFSPGSGHGATVEIPGLPSESSPSPPLATADDSVSSGPAETGENGAEISSQTSPSIDSKLSALGTDDASDPGPSNGMEHFERLQRRLLFATTIAVAAAVPITGLLFDGPTALSLLLGGLGGLLYLRLLARSVSRLGGDRRSVGKFQLLVPVVLVLAAARIPNLQILPVLLGFLLYKPALILQALLDL